MGPSVIASTRDVNIIDPNAMAKNKYTPPEEKDAQFWYDIANEEIAKRLALPQPDKRQAKNIIMFLGDGMSLTTIAAARILKGQLKGNTGEEDSLSFEKFPYTGLSRVSREQNSLISTSILVDIPISDRPIAPMLKCQTLPALPPPICVASRPTLSPWASRPT